MAAKPSSERIDESPVAAFHERSSGFRENARRTAIALEIFRQEIESGLARARAVGTSHSGHQVARNQSVTGEKDLHWSALARYSSTAPSFEAASIRILLLCAAFSES